MNGGKGKRLLVIGRLLKSTGHGRREKVAEELRAFAKNGYGIDVVTLDDETPEILERYQQELEGVVGSWFIWRDPFLTLIRSCKRGILRAKGRRNSIEAAKELSKPLRPKLAPSHPFNALLSLPDPNLGWALAHRRQLRRLVKERGYTHLYTISSPHSVHFAGLWLKRRFQKLHWVMSYRDPWSNYPLQHPGRFTTWLNRKAEQFCLQHCDRALIYRGWTPGGVQFFRSTFPLSATKVVESPYIGCDEAAIDRVLAVPHFSSAPVPHELRFVHLGTLYGNDHTPRPFLEALTKFLENRRTDTAVKVHFLGGITADARELLAKNELLRGSVTVEPYLPFDEAIRLVAQADVALWFQADDSHFRENVPAKVFEYVYLRLPVLAISASENGYPILDQHGIGRTVPARDLEGIRHAIDDYAADKRRKGDVRCEPNDLFARTRFVEWFESNIAGTSP